MSLPASRMSSCACSWEMGKAQTYQRLLVEQEKAATHRRTALNQRNAAVWENTLPPQSWGRRLGPGRTDAR